MPRFVAFLRAVNVRPRWVKMGELREHLTAAGYADVETHIQSGNVHLAWSGTDPDELAAELTRSISTRWGFEVPTMVRRPEELVDIAETAAALPSPFPPNTPTKRYKRYVSFLSAEPSADAVVRLGAVDAPGERVTVVGRHVVAVLSVPFHEAKLTNVRTERVLGVRSTARDLRVVAALAQRWGPR